MSATHLSRQSPEDMPDQLREVWTTLKELTGDATFVEVFAQTPELLNFVMMDGRSGNYPGRLSPALVKELGLQVIDTRLITKQSTPRYDSKLLVSALLSLT